MSATYFSAEKGSNGYVLQASLNLTFKVNGHYQDSVYFSDHTVTVRWYIGIIMDRDLGLYTLGISLADFDKSFELIPSMQIYLWWKRFKKSDLKPSTRHRSCRHLSFSNQVDATSISNLEIHKRAEALNPNAKLPLILGARESPPWSFPFVLSKYLAPCG